jgi:cytochrome c oxidase accessory protein FixG
LSETLVTKISKPVALEKASEAPVSLYQKPRKIYARAVSGRFSRWRWAAVWATQLVFYGLPWLQWNSRQAVLFDLGARRFYVFGLVLYPQDFIYLTGLLVIAAYSLFLFTAVAGRLFCGYACPQTVYTEILMWTERLFEGDRMQRMKLDTGPWSVERVLRKGGKQLVWICIGLWTGFTFVSYFTPARTLLLEAGSLGFGPWEWFWLLFYAFAVYGNAGWMREQVCIYLCPYARFQSAMFDADTLVIGYDAGRGEPRGTRGRGTDLATARLGHCIDCKLCVQVCPTGIDIRKGLQYECIGCAACVDVCNGVMNKMRYPVGLIRYDTQEGLECSASRQDVSGRLLRPRVLVYAAVLALICAALGASLAMRAPFKVDVVRDRGALARIVEDGWIENVYRVQLMNTTELEQIYRIRASGLPGMVSNVRRDVRVGPAQALWEPMAVRVPPQAGAAAGPGSHAIEFVVERVEGPPTGPPSSVAEKSTFVVPR